MSRWKQERDESLAEIEATAGPLMIAKMVEWVRAEAHDPESDCTNVLVIGFTDGTSVRISGGYGGYTGHSCDEYVEMIFVSPGQPENG